MVKSQTQQQKTEGGYSIANEELNEDLILHCWRLVQEQARRVIEFNRSQGVPNPDAYVGYNYADGSPEPMSVKQKLRWLNIIRHKKSGRPITVDSLVASERVSDIEREMFGQQKYPRVELSALTRVKTQDNSEYLMRGMQAIGLSEIGAIVTLPLYDCDFTRKVPISPSTAKLQDGMDVKILEVGTGEFTYETSPRIYTTPFNKENVLAAIEKYPPSEDNDTRGKITYALKREGTTNEVGISSLEEFIEGNFDELWTRQTTPNPQININSKDLATFVKLDRESRESHEQYQ
ncbi:MAG TPA: hypothetical protein VFR94_19150 [Nitrososphaeraceae archaeon]|nr:hypothetical protein [Nitrososphaeraceae archaeon]